MITSVWLISRINLWAAFRIYDTFSLSHKRNVLVEVLENRERMLSVWAQLIIEFDTTKSLLD